MNENLIIYFSRNGENYGVGYIQKGNTEVVCEYLKELIDADVFKVESLVPYSDEYKKCIVEAKERIGNAPIKKEINDISKYKIIYIMTPIYWGTYAPEIETAIKNLDFTGKEIRIITTHEGSHLGRVVEDIKKICKNGYVNENALSIFGSSASLSKNVVINWLNSFNKEE